MQATDLRAQYEHKRAEAIQKIRSYEDFTENHEKFKIGDVIEFRAGYYNQNKYKSEILGFDKDGHIYLLWDTYWFGIKDDEKRKIKKVSK
ncbi:hypothetical protein [Capnocytophaga sp.]|uniref:hypothetical protein n=1 Tax=Capnocytophaga sp. TaxID=44737 RepID=UPI0026DC9230|nr:hypothetical protein [Capnocytophaga sp.]MDO5106044.1 hypothetical protein [Capnocytophaga sp.]